MTQITGITSLFDTSSVLNNNSKITTDNNEAFSSVFQSALDMLNETNELQKQAEKRK